MGKLYPWPFLFVNNINRSKYIFGKRQHDKDYCLSAWYFPKIYLLLLIIVTTFKPKLTFLFRYKFLWLHYKQQKVKTNNIDHLIPPHDLMEPFFLSRGAIFTLTRIPFKHLALLNPTIGILSKTFPCSLSGLNSKCISDSTFLSFKSSGWYIILKTNLLLFPTLFRLFKTSDIENLIASRICPLTNLSLEPFPFSHTSKSLHRLSKMAFPEKILLRYKVWLKGIDFLQWEMLHELACRYWYVSVGFTYKSVTSWLPFLNSHIQKVYCCPGVFCCKLYSSMIAIKNP